MRSRWIITVLKYAVLLTPMALLVGLLALIGAGAWSAAILRGSAQFADAPSVIQKLTVPLYYRTRTEWMALPDCATFDGDLLFIPRPGTCEFRNAEFNTTLHVDERGFRRTAAPRAPPDAIARPRLVMVGDSHTMGWGVQDDETFPSLLASEAGFPAINLGVAGYGTVRELRRLQRDFTELQENDVIVLQYCDNDLAENHQFLATGKVGPYTQEQFATYLKAYRTTPTTTLPIAALIGRLILRDLRNQLPGMNRVSEATAAERVAGDPASVMLGVIEKFPVLRGHRLIVVALTPTLTSHLLPGREQFIKAGIPFVAPVLKKEDIFDMDDHMRASGHRAVKEAIVAELDKAGWSKLPGNPPTY